MLLQSSRKDHGNTHLICEAIILLALFAVAFFPRAMGLDRFSVLHESRWLARSFDFLESVGSGDWAGTSKGSFHPGVTIQWQGAAGIVAYYLPDIAFEESGLYVSQSPLAEIYQPSIDVLARARFFGVLLISLLVVGIYWCFKNMVGRPAALVASLFLALDPFYVGMSRVLHLDGLHATFALLSILGLGLGLQGKGRLWFGLSGVGAALAFLSKSSAIVLVPLILVASVVIYLIRREPRRAWKNLILNLTICYGTLAVTVFVVYPAMWVEPLHALRQIFDTAATYAVSVQEGGNFFFGEPVDDPGPLFYPVVLLFRGTPFALLGTLVTLFSVRRLVVREDREKLSGREVMVVLLWGLVITYTLALSFGMKKVNRYILPASLAIDLLGGMGLLAIVDWIGERSRAGTTRVVSSVGLSLMVIGQAVLCLSHYPYYFSYYNPLLGGGQAAAKTILVGWGEGFDQVIEYLNEKEDAGHIVLSTTHGSLLDFQRFKGLVVDFPPKWTSNKPQYPLAQVDYICIYLNWLQTHPLPESFYDLFESRQPEFTARAGGIEYAWLYKIDKSPYLSLPEGAVRADADYGNGLKLVGYEMFSASEETGGGYILPIKIYWQVERPCIEDYRFVLRLVDDSGREWASKSNYPPWGPTDCKESLGRWRGDLIYPDEHWLEIGEDTPSRPYSVEAIVIHVPDSQPLYTVGGEPSIRLGTLKIPPD